MSTPGQIERSGSSSSPAAGDGDGTSERTVAAALSWSMVLAFTVCSFESYLSLQAQWDAGSPAQNETAMSHLRKLRAPFPYNLGHGSI